MAMEFLDGKTLHRAIREVGTFPEDRVGHVARQVCRALREAHAHGVIHRDLKPANIFLVSHGDETDFVKVLDFGLVKDVSESKIEGEDLTQTGLFMGSPKYMAPEQIRGDRVDARTDVYSLGIILYEMLTGKVPFDKSNSVNILMAHVNEEPAPLRTMNPAIVVTAHMEEIVTRCMAKDPAKRFKSMDEVLGQLKKMTSAMSGTYTGMNESGIPPAVSGPTSLPQEIAQRISEPPQPTGPSGAVSASGAQQIATSPWPSQASIRTGTQEASVSPPGIVAPPGMLRTGSDPPPMRSGKGRVILVLVALLAAGAGGFAFLSRQPEMQGSSPSGKPPQKAEPPPPVVSAPPVPATPALVKVRVTSEPDGATVKEDGVEICTSTPCDVTYRGPDADVTKEHKLVIAKSGYRPETKLIKVGDTPIAVKLTRGTGGWAPTPRPVDPGKGPEGFKDLPY
jgi:eukaryotic-like serine/threonine-protein kinase